MHNTALAIIIAGFFIALGLYFSAPRYDIIPVPATTNPAVWKINRFSGDVSLCATGNGKETQSGCSAKLKQF